MPNLKNPLLSFGASGSLGESITFTKRRGQHLIEKKPELPYFLTLPVQYQRWLYQDYVYQWNLLTAAQKQVYASTGVRYHLTGFQYFMKYQLTNLPDLEGWWRLDAESQIINYDHSRNQFNGAVIGASPRTGLIAGALFFDNINDYCTTSFNPQAHISSGNPFTMMCFSNPTIGVDEGIMNCMDAVPNRFFININANQWIWGIGSGVDAFTGVVADLNQWQHIALVYDVPASIVRLYKNGVLVYSIPYVGNHTFPNLPLSIGAYNNNGVPFLYSGGEIDDCKMFNRVLDGTEIMRHSLRRWP